MSTSPGVESLPRSLRAFATASDPSDVEWRHFGLLVGCFLVAVAAAPLTHSLTLEAQLCFRAAAIGVFGLPHGALDFLQERVAPRPRWQEPRLGGDR